MADLIFHCYVRLPECDNHELLFVPGSGVVGSSGPKWPNPLPWGVIGTADPGSSVLGADPPSWGVCLRLVGFLQHHGIYIYIYLEPK